VDHQGFIFALPPLLVEGARQGGNHPNAVRASSDQIETLVNAVLPTTPQRSLPLDVPAAVSTGNIDSVNGSAQLAYAEIGQKVAPPAQIDKIEQAIKATPVENFDITRIVNVFAAYIQFYEFEVRGTQIQNKSIQLPKSLIGFIRDKSTRDRVCPASRPRPQPAILDRYGLVPEEQTRADGDAVAACLTPEGEARAFADPGPCGRPARRSAASRRTVGRSQPTRRIPSLSRIGP
jgi:hypothetical protein